MGVTRSSGNHPSGADVLRTPERFSIDRIGSALRGREQLVIEGPTHAAAVALVLRPRSRGLEALFIKRAEHPSDPWSGHVGLPGGRAETHDAGLVETAIRETEEEIGLRLDSHRDLLGGLGWALLGGRSMSSTSAGLGPAPRSQAWVSTLSETRA